MTKRAYTLTFKCDSEGCREYLHYQYKTRKDYDNAVSHHHGKKHYCAYHNAGNGALSRNNTSFHRVMVYTNTHKEGDSSHNYFETSQYKSRLGFISSTSSWTARANDFPPGTIIEEVVQVRVILPEPTAQPVATDAPRIAPAQPCACGSGINVLTCDTDGRCPQCCGTPF